jgi:hypothetical protein
MRDAYWTGYLIDLVHTQSGDHARLIFVYPDTGVLDVKLLIHTVSSGLAFVEITNLGCSIYTYDTLNVKDNAWLIYEAGINTDAASGIAIALNLISRLLDAGCKYELDMNLAEFGGLPMLAEDAISMYRKIYEHVDELCCELPF